MLLPACARSSGAPVERPGPVSIPALAAESTPAPSNTIVAVTSIPAATEFALGCSDSPREPTARDSLVAVVTAGRARWTSVGPVHARYEVRVINGMMALPPARVVVIGDSIVSPRSGENDSQEFGPTWLFSRAEAVAQMPVGRVELEFDQQYGLPTRIFGDPSRCMADDAVTIRVSSLVTRRTRE